MKDKRQLKNMSIEEVSLVDKGANRKKWFLIKREDEITELTIKTDGTFAGTTLSVNGEEVEDLQSFWFMLWPPDDFDQGMMNGSYTVSATDGAEFDRETTFNLKKGMNTMKLETVLKSLGIDPASLSADRTQDLESLIKFIDRMPPEDGASALNIIKESLVKEEAPAEGSSAEDDPATNEMEPEKVAEIKAAMLQLNGLLPEAEQSVLKTEEPDKMDLILDAIGKLDKTDDGSPGDSGGDAPVTLADIMKRLVKVEKTTGGSEDEDEKEDRDLDPERVLTSEERLKKYGTKYPKAVANFGLELLQGP